VLRPLEENSLKRKTFHFSLKIPMMIFIRTITFLSLIFICFSFKINCPSLPSHKPTSVYELHPNDIKVISVLGDSITAGFGIKGKEGLLDEFRGLSGPIGGDENAITLANFFKYFVPNLQGASIGKHSFELPYFKYHPELDQLNAAQSGATVDNLDFQVSYLIQEMKSNSKIDFTNDWKLITILIGANDACPLCEGAHPPSVDAAADKFAKTYSTIIDRLQKEIPRLFVNVLPMFNVSGIYYLTRNSTYCKDLHKVPIECPCGYSPDISKRTYMDSVLQAYDVRMHAIAQNWQKKHLNDFIVTLQPLFVNMTIPDFSYLSTLDCFHPSLKAHEKLAIAIWNSLISPVSKKRRALYPDDPFLCPDANTLLYTELY